MDRIVFMLCLVFLGSLNAQSVYEIPWEQGITPSAASLTIERGDTVVWTWNGSGIYKSVSSLSNGSEQFDSGILMGGQNSFSHRFTNLGVTRYRNDNNPLMRGKITVVASLSEEDKFVKNLSFYPNPVHTSLTVSSFNKIRRYQIYNVLGTLVAQGKASENIIDINMNSLNSGLYFVKVFASNDLQATLKIAKELPSQLAPAFILYCETYSVSRIVGIRNRRCKQLQNNRVLYSQGVITRRKKSMLQLPNTEFIRCLVLSVLPIGFVRLHHYGIYNSNGLFGAGGPPK